MAVSKTLIARGCALALCDVADAIFDAYLANGDVMEQVTRDFSRLGLSTEDGGCNQHDGASCFSEWFQLYHVDTTGVAEQFGTRAYKQAFMHELNELYARWYYEVRGGAR